MYLKRKYLIEQTIFFCIFNNFFLIELSSYWKENNWTVLKTPKYPAFSFNERELVREVKILTDSFQASKIVFLSS